MLLDDERIDLDTLAIIVQQLLVHDGDPLPSLVALDRFSAVSWYAFKHVRANAPQLVRDLLSVDMGMLPSALATMIRQMEAPERTSLVRLAECWHTPNAIVPNDSFSDCTALTLPKLPSSLTAIGNLAFYECTSLNVVEWDAPLLATVGHFAFSYCANLTLHTWHAPELEVFEYGVFEGCSALVLSKWGTPKLTEILCGAFMDCAKLTLEEWNAPLLSSIGGQAFFECTSLVLPDGLPGDLNNMRIGVAAFYGCTNLSPLARSQIEQINPNAFDSV